MKIISGLLLFILAGVHTYAQQDAKVIAEIAAGNERAIKNSPFSAEAVSESVQTLADGNRIVRSSTSKLYRNSEGRFRREVAGGNGGVFGTHFSFGSGVSIMDPVAGVRLSLNDEARTARVLELDAARKLSIAGTAQGGGTRVRAASPAAEASAADRAEIETRIRASQNLTDEQKAEITAKVVKARKLEEISSAPMIVGDDVVVARAGEGSFAISTAPLARVDMGHSRYESRTEDLGTRDFDGVAAEGIRRVTTIPEGAIGNERAIEIVYERWYSRDLGLVVFSKHSDPRFGEQTYRITNLVRAEPDPSLFKVPSGYRVLTESTPVYRIPEKPSIPAQSAVSGRPAAPPKAPSAVSVKHNKP